TRSHTYYTLFPYTTLFRSALSTTSTEKALLALQEIPNWNFNQVKQNAENQWEKELAKIKVESKDETLKKIFYSALYHTAVSPTLDRKSTRLNSSHVKISYA